MVTDKIKTVKKEKAEQGLLAVIRITGPINLTQDMNGTLDRLRLRRKYACVFLDPKDKNIKGMLDKVKFFVAYGEIEENTLTELIKIRGRVDKSKEGHEKLKIDEKKFASEILKGKKLTELGLKPFFRLHPPLGGIKSKLQYPKGVKGNNKKDINKLIMRML